jgi:hypothetical protein
MESTVKWAREEFGSAELGDRRRTRRLVAVAAEVARRPAGTVTRACGSSASREGAFRLLENDAVRPWAILRSVQQATGQRCADQQMVFVAVDGTSLHITDSRKCKDVGSIGSRHRGARGLQVMTALALNNQGAPLGIVGQKMWARTGRSKRDPKGRPQHGGENIHWQDVIEDCQRTLSDSAPGSTPWYQLDRGADCWQVLTYAKRSKVTLTVRAVHDRRLDADADRLWQAIEKAPVLATKWIQVPARETRQRRRRFGKVRFNEFIAARPARRAKVAVHAATVPLIVATPDGKETLEFNAVLVREVKRAKQPVTWLLLTTHPVESRVAALEVVLGYTFRWRIEDLHRAWKRGLCRVEDTQLRSRSAIEKWATLLATVATRAMRLTHQARATPDAPATDELSRAEIEALIALRQPKNQSGNVPTLGEAVRWIADLGGYTGPWNGPPGATVIGRGLHDVLVAAQAFESRDKKR